MPESRQTEIPDPPLAMFRGSIRAGWRLHGIGGAILTYLGGISAEVSRAQAQAWCEKHDYYLSGWSDADDRFELACSDRPDEHEHVTDCYRQSSA